MELSSEDIKRFQEKILSWYQKNKRDLPWREIPVGTSLEQKAYRILVSEVMLQQTQVSRVIPKYEAWLEKFPSVESLAKASVRDVLSVWMGLGYNRRALHLKKCAEALVELRIANLESRGKEEANLYWPQTEKELLRLPGIGKYTARALLCFAFGKQVAVVDTNVKKVILTQFQVPNFKSQSPSEKDLQKMADLLLPKGKARDPVRLSSESVAGRWNQALMDYSASVLKKEKIPIPKQSRYVGSDRYYRAKILKLLLEEKRIPFVTLGKRLRSDFSDKDTMWLEKIVVSLEKDELIVRKNGRLQFKEVEPHIKL